jgi:hypothetical protein
VRAAKHLIRKCATLRLRFHGSVACGNGGTRATTYSRTPVSLHVRMLDVTKCLIQSLTISARRGGFYAADVRALKPARAVYFATSLLALGSAAQHFRLSDQRGSAPSRLRVEALRRLFSPRRRPKGDRTSLLSAYARDALLHGTTRLQ